MNDTMPRLAVSACLVGEAVRYDGESRLQPLLEERWSRHLDLLPFCPEVEAGLGVPRPPVQVRIDGRGARVVEVERPARDHTSELRDAVDAIGSRLGEVDGWLFKARSPSCGVGSTPLFDPEGRESGVGDGLASGLLAPDREGVPVGEETLLEDRGAREGFVERLFVAFRWRRQVVAEGEATRRFLHAHRTHLALRDEGFLGRWLRRLAEGADGAACRKEMLKLLQRPWEAAHLEARIQRLLDEERVGKRVRSEVRAELDGWREGYCSLGGLVDGLSRYLPRGTAGDLWFHPPAGERALRYEGR